MPDTLFDHQINIPVQTAIDAAARLQQELEAIKAHNLRLPLISAERRQHMYELALRLGLQLAELGGILSHSELTKLVSSRLPYTAELDQQLNAAYWLLSEAVAHVQPTFSLIWVRSRLMSKCIGLEAIEQVRGSRFHVVVVELRTREGINVSTDEGFERYKRELEADNVVDAYRLCIIHVMDPVV